MKRILGVLAIGALAAPALAQKLPLGERVAAVCPNPAEERWLLDIAWRSDIIQARRDANESGKPIFMWLMNGDPLGCT
jgi:hypothetical protein